MVKEGLYIHVNKVIIVLETLENESLCGVLPDLYCKLHNYTVSHVH